MSLESSLIERREDVATSRLRRLDPRPEVARWYAADVLVAAVGLVLALEHFRCRANYATCPFLALIPPAILAVASRDYRLRAVGWLRALWGRAGAYSAGSGRIPWTAALVLVVVPTWLLDLSNGKTLGALDTQPVIPTAVSLLSEGDMELGEYLAAGSKVRVVNRSGYLYACYRVEGGRIYSGYPAGMVPFAAATAGLAALLDANLADNQVQLRLEKVTAAALGAACVGLFFLIALSVGPPGAAWTAAALLAAGSGMFSTVGMATWQHGGVIFWASIALLVEFHSAGRPGRRGAALQGACCALMASCRLTSISLLVPFGAWVLARDPARAARIVAVAALAFAPWAWAYARTYASPLGPSTSFLSGGLWTSDVLAPLLGVLVSPARGLLVYQPWVVLGFLAILPRFRADRAGRASPPGWVAFALAAIAAHLLLISVWGCWWGGWCWGARLVVEVVPLCALLAVRPVATLLGSRAGRSLVIGLGLLAVAAQLPGVYLDSSTWNARARFPGDLWSWSRPPFLEWSRR